MKSIIMATAIAAAGGLALLAGVGCSNDSSSGPKVQGYDPEIPSQWAEAVTNPYFPLLPGMRWEYEGDTEEGTETVVVEVLEESKAVNGVEATVVRDRVYLDGELIEDTVDWYAQDQAGNVWYLGEDTKELENGQVVSTEGSWEWAKDEALPGIIMWADPSSHMQEQYRQEYYEDEAEDWGKVVALNETVEVPFGSFTGCVKTEDWSGLEPGTLEDKWYAPNVGFVREVKVEGGGDEVELVTFTHE